MIFDRTGSTTRSKRNNSLTGEKNTTLASRKGGKGEEDGWRNASRVYVKRTSMQGVKSIVSRMASVAESPVIFLQRRHPLSSFTRSWFPRDFALPPQRNFNLTD